MTSCHLPLYCITFLCLLSSALSENGLQVRNEPWTKPDCRDNDVVTDILCCDDTGCSGKSQNECQIDHTCYWRNGECKAYRDTHNNVCCKSQTSEICGDIMEGRCPNIFQVLPQCCTDEKPELETEQGRVCCNTPCADAENNNQCQKHQYCGVNPLARSLGGHPGPQHHGLKIFSPHYLPKYPTYGHVGHKIYELPGKEHAVTGNVKEITVNDIMNAMVESLQSDKDAYTYESEIHTDPYFGKAKYGGHLGGVNLPDPDLFLKQIYGNPYGVSRGQFGLPGKGWPSAHGVNPGYGYGYLSGHNYGYGFRHPSYGYGHRQDSYGYGYPSQRHQSQYGYGYRNHDQSYGYGNQSPSYGYGYQSSSSRHGNHGY